MRRQRHTLLDGVVRRRDLVNTAQANYEKAIYFAHLNGISERRIAAALEVERSFVARVVSEQTELSLPDDRRPKAGNDEG